jgi:hypothetical protein
MVYLHNFIGSFSIPLIGENEEDVELYEEGYQCYRSTLIFPDFSLFFLTF